MSSPTCSPHVFSKRANTGPGRPPPTACRLNRVTGKMHDEVEVSITSSAQATSSGNRSRSKNGISNASASSRTTATLITGKNLLVRRRNKAFAFHVNQQVRGRRLHDEAVFVQQHGPGSRIDLPGLAIRAIIVHAAAAFQLSRPAGFRHLPDVGNRQRLAAFVSRSERRKRHRVRCAYRRSAASEWVPTSSRPAPA